MGADESLTAVAGERSLVAPLIWVLADGRAGNRAQCLGVAEALGWPFVVKDIVYDGWAAFPNIVRGASFWGLTAAARQTLVPPWPDVVIAAGRRTAPAARAIKRRSQGRCALVQIMDPGWGGLDDFDLIAVPNHDCIVLQPNMMAMTGVPHRVTPATLEAAAARWRDSFKDYPKPWIALIVGGSTRRRTFTETMARELGRTANVLAEDRNGSLLITTSRRTGAAANALFEEVTVPWFVYRWGDGGENPYLGFLALADGIIVTGDSVSMCSEACATAAPVYIYAPAALITEKHARLHQELYDKGYARPLRPPFEAWSHAPLNAAPAIAAEIRKRLKRA
jgi:mitochondrial fission protein ELM1